MKRLDLPLEYMGLRVGQCTVRRSGCQWLLMMVPRSQVWAMVRVVTSMEERVGKSGSDGGRGPRGGWARVLWRVQVRVRMRIGEAAGYPNCACSLTLLPGNLSTAVVHPSLILRAC